MSEWQTIETAPQDGTPFVAWNVMLDLNEGCGCKFEGDGLKQMCLYHAHGEGLSYTPTGLAVVQWGGAFDDSTWEYPNQANMPDWWFRVGSEFEEVANPTHWMPTKPPQ